MSAQTEALRLADELDGEFVQGRISNHTGRKAATELRRLSAENERFAALVCDYAAEEAPDAIRKIAVDRDRWHTKAQQAEAQRDALLEALKEMLGVWEEDPAYGHASAEKARAAIKAVEGEKT